MSFWKQFPFIRLTLALIPGIIAGFLISQTAYLSPLWLIPPWLLLLIITFLPSKMISYRQRWIPGAVIFIFLIFLSWSMTTIRQKSDSLTDQVGKPILLIGEISEPVAQKAKSSKIIIRIKSVLKGGKWKYCSGKILIYLQKSEHSASLFYGDRIIFRTTPAKPLPAMNPGGFSSRDYLKYKGIFLQGYVRQDEWKLLNRNGQNPLLEMSLRWRDALLKIFRENGLTGREYAVASALLLGYTDDIDQQTMKDYSATGAMHILSVSGMHVGVIFIFLEKILSFLNKKKRGLLLKAGLIILFIWIYAMITGLSPAVLRAATMIMLVIIAGSWRRHTSIANILGVSLFFLLLMDPGLLFDIGFLLSYLAVGGIVLIYKPLYDLWTPVSKIIRNIWSVLAVSMAAQLSTLPLCLYYFHQFPNYFMITNLLVVPLSNLIIYTGICCLALGSVPFLSSVIALILEWMIRIMNEGIHFIGALPFAVTRGISLTLPEMFFLYTILIFLMIYFFRKRKKWFFLFLASCTIFTGMISIRHLKNTQKRGIIIYSTKSSFLADFYEGDRSYLFGDIRNLTDPYFAQTFEKNHQVTGLNNDFRCMMLPEIRNEKVFRYDNKLLKTDHFIEFCGKRVGVCDQKHLPEGRIRVDILIVSGNPYLRLSQMIASFDTKTIILDGTTSAWHVKQWQKEADSLHLKCHSIKNNGAFIFEF